MGLEKAVHERIARFGTPEPVAPPHRLAAGGLTLRLETGAVRGLALGGVEVVRGITYPVRDADWGTMPDRTLDETVEERQDGFAYERRFEVGEAFVGRFALRASATGEAATLDVDLRLEARQPVRVNRAGFVLLHPLRGVAGGALTIRHPDGSAEAAAFPKRISPSQPAFDIAGLAHDVRGVAVEIDFEGEVFEMEDQRNWTDASFKSYCRPLSRPRPYVIAAGETVSQRIAIRLARTGQAAGEAAEAGLRRGRLPAMTLSLDEALAPLGDRAAEAVSRVPFAGAQLRLTPESAACALAAAPRLALPLALEVVVPEGEAPEPALAVVAAACEAAGVAPIRVLALPKTYLASHQPEGPWPDGPTPEDAAAAARAAFPRVEVGAGMLTYFTELNRRPPRSGAGHLSFGTAAIVHAADDASVLETLEALPHVFESARALAEGRPLRLGLVSIGMRSNPYGAAVAPNPQLRRIAMACADPRQRGLLAAAFLVSAAAAAAEAGVASLSPAMATGPLGLVDEDGARPIFHVACALAGLQDAEVEIEGRAPGGLLRLKAAGRSGLQGLAAHLGDAPATLETEDEALVLSASSVAAARSADWLDAAPRVRGAVRLDPLDVAFLFSEGGR